MQLGHAYHTGKKVAVSCAALIYRSEKIPSYTGCNGKYTGQHLYKVRAYDGYQGRPNLGSLRYWKVLCLQ